MTILELFKAVGDYGIAGLAIGALLWVIKFTFTKVQTEIQAMNQSLSDKLDAAIKQVTDEHHQQLDKMFDLTSGVTLQHTLQNEKIGDIATIDRMEHAQIREILVRIETKLDK